MNLGRFVTTIWLNRACISIFLAVILGGFYQEYVHDMQPCDLCFLQRVMMLSISMSSFWNLFYKVSVTNYGFGILSALLGGAVAIRQILLHICPQFSTFGYPVFGLELYTWSFLMFVVYIIGASIGLFLYNDEFSHHRPTSCWIDKTLAALFSVIVLANFINALFVD